MATDIKGEIRRSQLITTYGVGSVVAIDDESFMVVGTDRWRSGLIDLHEPRLERRLQVDGFRLPPSSDDLSDIPVVRFPKWTHCPTCKRLDDHGKLGSIFKNTCNSCGSRLVPSRFVICCEAGHIDDFPWFQWVHSGSPRNEGSHRMSIATTGTTASVGDITVSCECGKKATLEGVFGREAMRGVAGCKGRRPWLTTDDDDCDQLPRALQRGASNVWFSVTHSAISIPPWSIGAFKVLNRQWEVLRYLTDDISLTTVIKGMGLSEGTGYSTEDLVAVIKQRQAGEVGNIGDQAELPDLKKDEYRALIGSTPEMDREQDFVCLPGTVPASLAPWISRVNLVTRLRVVRALETFSRIVPHGGESGGGQPLSESKLNWLPAVEINGEGAFFEIDGDALRRWESEPEVIQRVAEVNRRHQRRGAPGNARTITPRLMMVHTLAHAVITQWALNSGYPTASLCERIYVDEEMAGFLIYTATSDSSGSLGGIIAEAEEEPLSRNFHEAITRASWCSGDPLCVESTSSGTDGLNLAACHACALLPEVSCEEMNTLLDRALLVGLNEAPKIGFFRDLVR